MRTSIGRGGTPSTLRSALGGMANKMLTSAKVRGPALVMLSGAVLTGCRADAVTGPSSPSAAPAHMKEFVELVNATRRDAGCKKDLIWHEKGAVVAQGHSEDMNDRGYFGHVSPDGGTLKSRLQQGGVSFSAAGENIARGQTTNEKVVSDGLDSPGHRANLLNCNFTHQGLGLVNRHWTHVLLR
jgi:uncharacterized protein YkwD